VQLGKDDDLCIFKNFDDSWCISATPPMVQAGWEWAQTYTTTPVTETPIVDYYQLEFQPFVAVQAQIISSLLLQNIWVNNVTFDLDQFKANLFISLIFNSNLEVCPGIGWEAERLLFRVLYTMKFWNCSKTLIDDLADYSSTWTGVDAKYFEDCSESNDEEIIVYEKEYREALEDQIFYGTTTANSVKYCVGFFGSSSSVGPGASTDPAYLLAKMAYKNFFNWMQVAYPESFE